MLAHFLHKNVYYFFQKDKVKRWHENDYYRSVTVRNWWVTTVQRQGFLPPWDAIAYNNPYIEDLDVPVIIGSLLL